MSGDDAEQPQGQRVGRLWRAARGAVEQTRWATETTLSDRGGRWTVAAVTLAYTTIYLAAVGDLGLLSTPLTEIGLFSAEVVQNPLSRALGGEAVAVLQIGPVETLVDPGTVAVAFTLGALVGITLGVSTLAYRRPAVCDVSPATGILAGIPALLSGTACCGPLVLLVIGVQASSALVAAISWLQPAAVLLLLASLVWASSRLARGRDQSESSGKILSGM